MEELINELNGFVNEKIVLSAQIRDIENKRNELANERNNKKAQNKIKNDGEVWAEVNCLGKQISDLGNQSQWFQNQINSKLLNIREQAFIEIDNLIAENVRKSRIISEQIEENNDSLEKEEIYELTEIVNRIGKDIARIIFAKSLIKHNQIIDVINLFSQSNMEENQKAEEKKEVENEALNICEEELKVEEFKPIEDIINDSIAEECNKISENVDVEEYDNNIDDIDEITRILERHFAKENKEEEIITFEENEEQQAIEENIIEEQTMIKNIVVKVEKNELVYKAELSNGSTIKIYPVREKLLEKERFERETWKRDLIEYSAKEYRNLKKVAIKKMDPIVCEILDRFAVQYDVDSQNLVYNYVMSFSTMDEYDTNILPIITYNLSYINEAKISKKEIKTLYKIVKNSNQNSLIDIVGNVTLSAKIKCFMKKIFNLNNANILPAGEKE